MAALGTAWKIAKGSFIFTAVAGTLLGVPAAAALAADPTAGIGEVASSAVKTVFTNVANIPETAHAAWNTTSWAFSGIAAAFAGPAVA